ncbi:ABC transporter ATP-binding protein [Mycobacterium tuberculosis]|nr:ABC transporter ATP-binding protein [Mycobacterium tuberculosis]
MHTSEFPDPPTPGGTHSLGVAGARATNISKFFPGTRALDHVSLEVRPGEIHGLIGGNGSGKSTLIKILAGIYTGDPGGRVEIGGRACGADEVTPEFARDNGLHVVHQDLGVFPDLSVAENLTLGNRYERRSSGLIRWSDVRRRAERLIEQFEIDVRPDDSMRAVRQSSRTLIAIARACQDEQTRGSGLLILDEPTASLPAHEVAVLLEKLRSYAAAGQAILYVSHRLDEVLQLTDRVTALRDGENMGTFETAELDEDGLVELIAGPSARTTISETSPKAIARIDHEPSHARLVVDGLRVGGLRDVSFRIARGEIVGIAGLLGSGRSTLLQSLFGLAPHTGGSVTVNGSDVRFTSVAQAMQAGVAYVPENRAEQAIFLDESVALNLAAGRTQEFKRGMRIRYRSLRNDAKRLIASFGIKAASVDSTIATLSGGNQQKVVMARWVSGEPRLLLLDEPSQGVDVGARAEIWRIVRDAASRGTSVLVVTSDFEELASVVDRAIVLREGTTIAELTRTELTAHSLTRLVYFDPKDA